ncbi:MAG: hypothetical protein GX295_05955 [Syntrophomonadaceae bacterium]|nr:hypothetical protein [Syntrophomonadaceae bacterium]
MNGILAGVIAAAISWPVNSWITERGGCWGLVFWVPLLEETLKTGLARQLGGELVLAHAVFGLIEGLYELQRDRRIGSAVIALGGHLFFGVMTGILWSFFPYWSLAVLGVAFLHSVWNWIILKLFTKGSG